MIFGHDVLMQKYRRLVYHGFLDELKRIYNDQISTNKLSKSIKLLINSTRLNWMTKDDKGVLVSAGNRVKKCPFCDGSIQNAAYHLIWLCSEVTRPDDMKWTKRSDHTENIRFLEGLQLAIDEL